MNRVKQAVHYWCSDTINKRYTGQGVGIAVLDTGIARHPDFDGRIHEFKDCVRHKKEIYDDSGHGTHVAGIIAGSGQISGGTFAGMAPGANLVSVKVLDKDGEGSTEQILEGIQWLMKNWYKYGIRIVNISVGAKNNLGEKKEHELIDGVEMLWDEGLVVLASAGNYGPGEGTISIPGASRKIITVGISDYKKESYSGCGPTKYCVVKPDVVAPGQLVASCNSQYYNRKNRPYVRKSGTSMAAPVVSGAIALLLEKYPDMSNVEVKLRLRECCDNVNPSWHSQGWGQVNISKMLA